MPVYSTKGQQSVNPYNANTPRLTKPSFFYTATGQERKGATRLFDVINTTARIGGSVIGGMIGGPTGAKIGGAIGGGITEGLETGLRSRAAKRAGTSGNIVGADTRANYEASPLDILKDVGSGAIEGYGTSGKIKSTLSQLSSSSPELSKKVGDLFLKKQGGTKSEAAKAILGDDIQKPSLMNLRVKPVSQQVTDKKIKDLFGGDQKDTPQMKNIGDALNQVAGGENKGQNIQGFLNLLQAIK